MPLFEPLFRALNATGARYVVVGGLATVLHGYARLTADVDLVVDLAPEPAGRLVDALVGLGLVPRAPVDAAGFADPEIRERWVRDKGMQVFSFVDRANPMRAVDLFVQYPIDFESLWSRAQVMTLESTTVPVANLDDLITMKRIAPPAGSRRHRTARADSTAPRERAMTERRTELSTPNPWRVVTWLGHREAQLASTQSASPAQRLAWLEEVLLAAHRAGALPDPDSDRA